jgi:hypothetical protein
VKARGACRNQKKGTSNSDAPSNKTYGTACWAFIVAKSTGPKAAPMLEFRSLQRANKKFHPHIIHKGLWTVWGYSDRV